MVEPVLLFNIRYIMSKASERSDELGNRIKAYEHIETAQQFRPNSVLVARLDGRAFSRFTKGLKRPYDERMSQLMITCTQHLVKEHKAHVGYTQSDEISLVLTNPYGSPVEFNGKKQKMLSVLASSLTSVFVANLVNSIPEKLNLSKLPTFDCRIFEVPDKGEATNVLLWREYDAKKNSITMAAGEYFSHKELIGKNGAVKIDMLKTKHNVIWEDYPNFFKYGTYVKRQRKPMPDPSVIRHEVVPIEFTMINTSLEDRVRFVFGD